MPIGAPQIGKALFGGVLDVDGGGHYPGLELINFVVCNADGLLLSDEGPTRLRKVAHDFARRLVTGKLDEKTKDAVLLDEHAATAVSHLLRCLELEIPNAIKSKGWERTHFFPYTRSLVHWDARARQKAGQETVASKDVRIERRYFRGAGAYAYKSLRLDSDLSRLSDIRAGFARLYPQTSDAPLELLASTLLSHGTSEKDPSKDQIELETEIMGDSLDDLYRDGVRNIVGHIESPAVQRVRALMNWTSIWFSLAQSVRFSGDTSAAPPVIVDCSGTHPQLRRAAQRCLKEHISSIDARARRWVTDHGEKPIEQQIGKVRGFFASTAAAGGLLNSWIGRRHFTLRLPAIEALVLAAVPPGEEIEFESFLTDWLHGRCRIVAGREGAARSNLLNSFDATIFEENERRLAEQMASAGLLRVFSDATRMVSPGATR